VEFSEDISPLIAGLRPRIEGLAFDPAAKTGAFNFRGQPVVIDANKIAIHNIEGEQDARALIEWLNGLLNDFEVSQSRHTPGLYKQVKRKR
jgi:hypothetical protein